MKDEILRTGGTYIYIYEAGALIKGRRGHSRKGTGDLL